MNPIFKGKRKDKKDRGAGHKSIVFVIPERGGKVSVSVVPDVKAESLMNETVRRVRRGSIMYTDTWKGYDIKETEWRYNHREKCYLPT